MAVHHDHTYPTSRDDSRDLDQTRNVSRDGGSDVNLCDDDALEVAEGRGHEALPSPAESKYVAAAPTATTVPRSGKDLRIELPQHDPVITPAAANALLRLVLEVASREQPHIEQHPPSRST